MYIELSELLSSNHNELFWKETARWMNYEQDFDEESGQWSLPHVSALEFHSLQIVKQAIKEGIFLFDREDMVDFPTTVLSILDEVVHARHMDNEEAYLLMQVLQKKLDHAQESTFWKSVKST